MSGFVIGILIFVGIVAIFVGIGIFARRKSAEREEKSPGVIAKTMKEVKEKNFLNLALFLAGFLMLVFAIRSSFPAFWEWWYGDTEFFWISVIGFFVALVLLAISANFSSTLGCAIIVLILAGGYHKVPDSLWLEMKYVGENNRYFRVVDDSLVPIVQKEVVGPDGILLTTPSTAILSDGLPESAPRLSGRPQIRIQLDAGAREVLVVADSRGLVLADGEIAPGGSFLVRPKNGVELGERTPIVTWWFCTAGMPECSN